jgi:hypothetical protein
MTWRGRCSSTLRTCCANGSLKFRRTATCNLAILGGGKIVLDITAGKATWNRYPVEPLPYATEAKLWIENQLEARKIAHDQLVGASLIVDYAVRVAPSATEGIFQTGTFEFSCTGAIMSPDREYIANLKAVKIWGLMPV